MKLLSQIFPFLYYYYYNSVTSFVIQPEQQHLFMDCSNWQGLDSCKSGDQIDYPESSNSRRWQTPPPYSPLYRSTEWQNYNSLQGYARVLYSEGYSQATVSVQTIIKCSDAKDIRYRFGGSDAEWVKDSEYVVKKSDFDALLAKEGDDAYMKGLEVEVWVRDCNNASLVLDPLYFIWQNPPLEPGKFEDGQRGAIVELFGWPFDDVAKECETFLSKAGYMGVKIFPAQEHVESFYYLQNGELNPWYFSYQPVSYRLVSRLGSREQLRRMIVTCRKHGVRVYADAVVNHMSGSGNDVGFHRTPAGGSCAQWGPKNSSGNSPYFTHSWSYEKNTFTNERPALEFPAVPYGPTDFHCERSMNSWTSGFSLNYGWLVGLTDLNTQKPYVQQRIADFFTDLLAMGFSGFRIDAAKHIRPVDLAQILGRFKVNLGNYYPKDFFTWLEVIIGGERDLLACQDNPYNYYTFLDSQLRQEGLSDSDIEKVKIWSSDYPKEHPICGHWILPSSRFVIQNDDHDQQNPGSSSRDMADKGSVLIKERDVNRHRMFEKQLFERRDGDWKIRMVLSSYSFMNSGAQGYPDGQSDCEKYLKNPYTSPYEQCKSVPYAKAFDAKACGYSVVQDGKWLEGAYTRVHRDREIVLAMRKWTGLSVQVANKDIGLPENCQ